MTLPIFLMVFSSTVFFVSTVFQIHHIWKQNSAKDVSTLFVGFMLLGLISLLLLVIVTDANWKVIFDRAFSVFNILVLLVVTLYYKHIKK